MWLTKNEKKVLQLLLENSRVSDTDIAKKLNISSQAVGRIRKELEEELITNYSLDINIDKVGIKVCTIIRFDIPKNLNQKEMETELASLDNLIGLVRTMCRHSCYFANLAFRNLEEMENFLTTNKTMGKLDISEVTPFPKKGILKLSLKNIALWSISNSETKKTNFEL